MLPLLVVAALYVPSLSNGFTFDDPSVIADVSDFLSDPGQLSSLASRDYFRVSGESTYRPVVTLTYMLDWQIGGGSASAFHLQSLFWHLVAVGCLGLLLRRMGADDAISVLAPAIYGLHPALTEAVDAIAFREDVLVTAFGLLGLVVMVDGSPRRHPIVRTILGSACFVLACLSKESGLVFAALLPLTQWAAGRMRQPRTTWSPRVHVREYAAVALALLAYLVVRFVALPSHEAYGVRIGGSLLLSLATGIVAVGHYLLLFAIPYPLCADYRGVVPVVTSPVDWRVWTTLVTIGGLSVAVAVWRTRSPLALWGWVWFLIALAPVLNVIPIPTFMAERFLHLPFAGLVAGAVAAAREAARAWPNAMARRAIAAGAVIVLASAGGLTWSRHAVWSSNDVLWAKTLEDHPTAEGAIHGRGSALIEAGQYADGIPYLRRLAENPAVSVDRRAAVDLELGFAHAAMDQLDLARRYFEASLAEAPSARGHQSLAVVLFRQGLVAEAETQLRAAVALQPDDADAQNSLGAVLASQRRFDEAIAAYREAIRLRPSLASAHADLGMALAETGHPDDGIASLLTAISLDPQQARWREAAAALLEQRGRTAEAEALRARSR